MGGVFVDSDNIGRSHSGIMTHHIGGMGHALLGLAALGGDDLLTVLYCGDVSVDSAHGAGDTSWHMGWDIVTGLDGDAVADWV